MELYKYTFSYTEKDKNVNITDTVIAGSKATAMILAANKLNEPKNYNIKIDFKQKNLKLNTNSISLKE